MALTHRVTRCTTILKSIANTFDMNAMVGCGLHQLKMPRLDAYQEGAGDPMKSRGGSIRSGRRNWAF